MSPSSGRVNWSTFLLVLNIFTVITVHAGKKKAPAPVPKGSDDLTEKIIKALRAEAEKIPIADFQYDPILLQKVDTESKSSTYELHNDETLYSHDQVDSGQKTIVLHADADGSKKVEKRRFVVLRQSIENKQSYYATFAYVKNADKKDDGKVSVNGKDFLIEYAPWDNRDSSENLLKQFGWLECRGTIFVPCWSNETDALKLQFFQSSPKRSKNRTSLHPSDGKPDKPTGKPKPKPTVKPGSTKIQSAAGKGEIDSTYDFFGDLECDAIPPVKSPDPGPPVKGPPVKGQDAGPKKGRYAGESVKYLIKGKIVTATLNSKIESEIVQSIKTGQNSLTDLSPDLLIAILAKYGKEKVGGLTFEELVIKAGLNYTQINKGNEQFLEGDAVFIVKEILDGDNSTDLLHEKEIIQVDGPKPGPTPKPGSGPVPPPTPPAGGSIIVNINNNISIVNNNYYGAPNNYTTGGRDDGSRPPWGPPPSPGNVISDAEKEKLYREFLERLKQEAIHTCPPGKRCKVVQIFNTTTGSTPFSKNQMWTPSVRSYHPGGFYSSPYYPGAFYPPPYVVPVVPVYPVYSQVIVMRLPIIGFSGVAITPFGRSTRSFWKNRAPVSDISSSLNHPGWKPINYKRTVNVSLDYEKTPFIGFGYCPVKVVTKNELQKVKSTEDAISLYMDVLRIGCIQTEAPYLKVLAKLKCLNLRKDKSFEVPGSCQHLKKKKLTGVETRELSRAFELSVLSQQFVSQLEKPEPKTVNPDGQPISRAVCTLGKFVQSAVSLYPVQAPSHSVKLTRNLILTLRTAYNKLMEDQFEINDVCEEEECKVDKSVNDNDRLYLFALTEFIIRGVGDKRKSQTEVKGTFDKFYKTNVNALKSKLAEATL